MDFLVYIVAAGCSLMGASNGLTIQSPSYPNNYPNNQDETYNIAVENGQKIEITFETFDLEYVGGCYWDWVMVKEGQGQTLLDKTCGNTLPGVIISTTNNVDVFFHSDYSVQRKGFKLSWKTTDGDVHELGCATPPYTGRTRGAGGYNILLWDKGIVPFQFTSKFNQADRDTFDFAAEVISSSTCIQFKARAAEASYLSIDRKCTFTCAACTTDCFSGGWTDGLGRQSPRSLNIGSDVTLGKNNEVNVGFVAHEILHALGVVHTQTRPDSSRTITTNFDNITPDGKAQYLPCPDCNTYNTEYDCRSVMHYRDSFFAISPGKKTMTANDPATCDLRSNNNKLTKSDSELLNRMYSCQKGCFNQQIDFPGNDINNGEKTASALECQTKCSSTPECWNFAWHTYHHNCWLKSELGKGNFFEWAVTGPKSCKGCCGVLNVMGQTGGTDKYGRYYKSEDYNGKSVYRHENGNWCIFYGGHWKVETCNWLGNDNSRGYIWTKSSDTCPGDVGPLWRYYSWGSGGSASGPIDWTVRVDCVMTT